MKKAKPKFRVGQIVRSFTGEYVHIHSFFRNPVSRVYCYRVEGDPREPQVDERFLRALTKRERGA